MKDFFIGLFLLVSSLCTFIILLIGNFMINISLGPTLATVVGLLGMVTVCWQVKLAVYRMAGIK